MELHTNFDTSLIDINSIDPSQVTQIICDYCGGVPVIPVKCQLCHKIFCQDFFVQHVSNTLECPSCRNGGAFGNQNQILKLDNELTDEEFFQKREQGRNLLLNANLNPQEQQIFDNLRLRCPNYNVGCNVVLPLSQQSEHFTNCLQNCTYCNQAYLLNLQQLHQSQCLPYLEEQARIKEQERRQERVKLDLLAKEKEKEASIRILQNELIEQEMNLIHKKNKLFKTKLMAFMLFIVAALHLFNQREEQKEINVTIRSFNSVSHLLNDNLFKNLQEDTGLQIRQVRWENVMDEMRHHLINDKRYTLFDIDRFRDQLTPNDYFCEYFTQLVYFINNIERQSQNNKKLVVDCSQQRRSDEPRSGLGNECLKKQLSRDQFNNEVERVQKLSQLAQRKHLPISETDKKNLRDFFNQLESAIEHVSRGGHKEVIDSIHLLRDELQIQ